MLGSIEYDNSFSYILLFISGARFYYKSVVPNIMQI